MEGDAWFEENQEGQSGPIKPSAYVIEARNDISHHLYPKGHKHYNVPLDAEHEDMLFDKMWFVLSAKRILPCIN